MRRRPQNATKIDFGRARTTDVMAHKKPIDQRPFRSKTEHLLEKSLEAQYRGLAIPGLVAALAARKQQAGEKIAKALSGD
jgi:hypothetical protein